MSVYDPALPFQQRRVAYALVPGEEELVFIASDGEVLTRVLILHLVAHLRPGQVEDGASARIKDALEGHRWQDALVAWMDATGRRLNLQRRAGVD